MKAVVAMSMLLAMGICVDREEPPRGVSMVSGADPSVFHNVKKGQRLVVVKPSTDPKVETCAQIVNLSNTPFIAHFEAGTLRGVPHVMEPSKEAYRLCRAGSSKVESLLLVSDVDHAGPLKITTYVGAVKEIR